MSTRRKRRIEIQPKFKGPYLTQIVPQLYQTKISPGISEKAYGKYWVTIEERLIHHAHHCHQHQRYRAHSNSFIVNVTVAPSKAKATPIMFSRALDCTRMHKILFMSSQRDVDGMNNSFETPRHTLPMVNTPMEDRKCIKCLYYLRLCQLEFIFSSDFGNAVLAPPPAVVTQKSLNLRPVGRPTDTHPNTPKKNRAYTGEGTWDLQRGSHAQPFFVWLQLTQIQINVMFVTRFKNILR